MSPLHRLQTAARPAERAAVAADRFGRGAILLLMLLLAGCGSSPKKIEPVAGDDTMPDAVPRVEPKAKYGNMDSYVVYGRTYHTMDTSRGHVERGVASWYGQKFHGRKTSSGERYDMYQMTAAHKTLPLPTYARVTNLENGRSAVVKINDRGPFVDDRIIDLSFAAAKKLGVVQKGTARVEVASIDPRDNDGKVPKLQRVADEMFEQYNPRRAPLTRRPANPEVASATTPERLDSNAPAAIPAVASGDGSGLYLQVGAFGTRNNAEQLRRRVASLVQKPVQVRAPAAASATPALYKVQVGPVASRADADHLSRQLAALGIARPLVVQD
jgi:rare lipoprotein A